MNNTGIEKVSCLIHCDNSGLIWIIKVSWKISELDWKSPWGPYAEKSDPFKMNTLTIIRDVP